MRLHLLWPEIALQLALSFLAGMFIHSTALSTVARLAYLAWLVRLAAGIAMTQPHPSAGAESSGEAGAGVQLQQNKDSGEAPMNSPWIRTF